MTRKDYELIAERINTVVQHEVHKRQMEIGAAHLFSDKETKAYIDGMCSAIAALTTAFKLDNPRFDDDRFVEACGIGKEYFNETVSK